MMPGRERPVELSHLDQRAKPESMPTTPTLTFSPMQILTHTPPHIHNKKKNTHYGFSSWFGLASAMGETHWPVSIGGTVVGSVISLGTDVCTTVVFLLI